MDDRARAQGTALARSVGERHLDTVVASLRQTATALGVPHLVPAHRPADDVTTRRIAVLGQHSAKAAFVNELLSREVLDTVHGTGRLHVIEYGDRPSLTCVGTGRMPLDEEAWQQIDLQPVDWSVEVRVDAPLLSHPRAALIGLDLLTSSLSRGEIWQTVQSCHAALLVVDATAQITRSEVMLARELSRRAGPRLLGVVVVGMEDVVEPERDGVMRTIRRHTADFVPPERVVLGDPGARPRLVDLTALGQAAPEGRSVLFWGQVVTLMLAAEALRSVAAERRELLGASRLVQEQSRSRLAAEDAEATESWATVRLALRAQCAEFERVASRGVAQEASGLARSVVAEFRAAADKAGWVSELLVDRVHQGLLGIAELCDRLAAEAFTTALGTAQPLGLAGTAPSAARPNADDLGELLRDALAPLKQRDRVRLLARLGTGIAMAGVAVLAPGLPPVDRLIDPVVEGTTDALSRRSEDDSARAIETAVHRVAAEYAEAAVAAGRESFDQLIDALAEQFAGQQEIRRLGLVFGAECSAADLDALLARINVDITLLRSLT